MGLAAVQRAGQWYYPHTDALGSIRRWSDASGQVVGARDYDPYGAILQQQGVIPSPLGFAGEWHDSATGLQYLRARWYQPATGRFTQVDPFPGVLPLPATQHPYQYALNNPLRYTDPSGESVLLAVGLGALIGGAVGGIGYALQHPGQSLGEYARNAEFRRAVGIGAASGAVAGLVGWALPAGFAALGMKAATAGGAAFIGGITGALAAGAGRITANLLTPCMKWYTGVRSAMFWGALGGALLGWAGWHIRQWLYQRLISSPSPLSYNSPQYLEYKALRAQGYNAQEAYQLMQNFQSGVNPGNKFAFHFTNPRAATSIVREGRLRASLRGLRGPGVYAGTISTPSPFLKHAPGVGWGLAPGTTVRIPIELPVSPAMEYLLLPLRSLVIRGDVWFAR